MGNFESHHYTKEDLIAYNYEELVEICSVSYSAREICSEYDFWVMYCSHWKPSDRQLAFEHAVKNNHYNVVMVLCRDENVDVNCYSGHVFKYCKSNGMHKMHELLMSVSYD